MCQQHHRGPQERPLGKTAFTPLAFSFLFFSFLLSLYTQNLYAHKTTLGLAWGKMEMVSIKSPSVSSKSQYNPIQLVLFYSSVLSFGRNSWSELITCLAPAYDMLSSSYFSRPSLFVKLLQFCCKGRAYVRGRCYQGKKKMTWILSSVYRIHKKKNLFLHINKCCTFGVHIQI